VQTEQRKEARVPVIQQPRGQLQLLIDEYCIQVDKIRDVSSNGVSLELETQVEVDEQVRLRYVADGIDITLNGIVVWTMDTSEDADDTASPAQFYVGIELAAPSLLQAAWQIR